MVMMMRSRCPTNGTKSSAGGVDLSPRHIVAFNPPVQYPALARSYMPVSSYCRARNQSRKAAKAGVNDDLRDGKESVSPPSPPPGALRGAESRDMVTPIRQLRDGIFSGADDCP